MMIWVKKTKQYINDHVKKLCPLQLIDTVFQDFVDGNRWVDITTTTRYTAEADAIVTAVVTHDHGQTAGRVKSAGNDDDCKLGPVGSKGRVVMTFHCNSLYSYSQMSSVTNSVLRKLVPVVLFIPYAALDDECGAMEFRVKLEAPSGSVLLESSENFAAFQELKTRKCFADGVNILIPSGFVPGTSHFERSWASLPVSKTAILFWLSIPDGSTVLPSADALLKASKKSTVTIYEPVGEDAEFQAVNLPGRTSGLLMRANVKTSASATSTRDVNCPRVFTHLLISDASGSTGMSVNRSSNTSSNTTATGFPFGGHRSGHVTVRDQFNAMEILRIVNRLRTIPTLLGEGLIAVEDYWAEVVYAFDHTVLSYSCAVFQVGDIVQHVTRICDYLMTPDAAVLTSLQGLMQRNFATYDAFNSMKTLCEGIRKLSANGGTSFDVPASHAASKYAKFHGMVSKMASAKNRYVQSVDLRTFVNFDTDGGHNGGAGYLASISSMVQTWQVVGGIVNGFGSWVDQHCATEVAAALKGPCQLCTEIPDADSVGMNVHLLRDLSCWMRMVRFAPVKVQIHAGSISWKSRIGSRFENAMDVYAVKSIESDVSPLSFELPDVSFSTEFTSTTISGASAGDSFDLYFLSRCGNATALKSRLHALAGGEGMDVSVERESDVGVVMGYKWISLLSSATASTNTDFTFNRAVLPTTLVNGILDNLSFNWNIPTLSGSTALLGRERTENRAPIALDRQPSEPDSAITITIAPTFFGFGAAAAPGCAPNAFLSGKTWATRKRGSGVVPIAAGSPAFFGVAGAAPAVSSSGFGSASFGAPQPASFGGARRKLKSSAPKFNDDDTGDPSSSFLTPQQILDGTRYLELESNIHKSSANSSDALPYVEKFLKTLDFLLLTSCRLQQDPYAVTVVNFFCDHCKTSIAAGGFRAHCMECFDFDLCESCYNSRAPSGQHEANHFDNMAKVGKLSSQNAKGFVVDPLISTMFAASSPSPAAAVTKTPMDIRNSCTHKVLKRILIRFILAMRDWGILISADFNAISKVAVSLSITALTKDRQLLSAFGNPTVNAQLAITDGVTVAKMAESFLREIQSQLAK